MTFKRSAVLLLTCTTACVVPVALGQTVNFIVHGGLTSAACLPSLARTANTDDGVLALNRLASDALPVLGSTTDAGRFSISLNACGVSHHTVLSTWFYNSTAGAVSHGRLNHLSGHGAGWQYQLLPDGAGNTQLDVGVSPTLAVSPIHVDAQTVNATSLAYRVRYYRSGVTWIADTDSISAATYVLYHH